MAPLNENQLEVIRNERKQQIMDAALKVFAENGIKMTKISMIAKEAKVSHGLVYHYFKSKEEVLHESVAQLIGQGEDFVHLVANFEGTPLEKIRFFTKFALSEASIHVFRVIFHVLNTKSEVPLETREMVEKQGMMYVEMIYPLIIEGQAKGEIINEDPDVLTQIFLSTVSGLLMEGDIDLLQTKTDLTTNMLVRMLEK